MLFKMIYQPSSTPPTFLQSFVGKECRVYSFYGDNATVTFDNVDKVYVISIYDLVPKSCIKNIKENNITTSDQVIAKDKCIIVNEKPTKKKHKINNVTTENHLSTDTNINSQDLITTVMTFDGDINNDSNT